MSVLRMSSHYTNHCKELLDPLFFFKRCLTVDCQGSCHYKMTLWLKSINRWGLFSAYHILETFSVMGSNPLWVRIRISSS